MNRDTPVVYDPDPTDMQMRALDGLGLDDLQLSDISNPDVVKLLVSNQRVTLVQLKACQAKADGVLSENTKLRQNREDLRVDIARLQERVKTSWLEIPISVASGFAINMLTDDIKDGIGWFLLIITLVMLVFLRGTDILKAPGELLRMIKRGNDNA